MARLREKAGKRHTMPCHNLDEYLVAYLDGAGLRDVTGRLASLAKLVVACFGDIPDVISAAANR